MSADSYRRDVQRHQQEIARLQKQKADEAARAANDSRRANEAADGANRTSSAALKRSKLGDAQRHQDSAVRHQRAVADLEAKIAREQDRLNIAQRRLQQEEEQERRRQDRDREQKERAHQQRLQAITGQLTKHQAMHAVASAAISKLQQLPEQITVLFLAANPLDQQQLRLDEEVRAIGDMIRKSEHRDSVRLESRWAVRPLDVLQAINECRPRIVHFSGHGSDRDEVVFQDNDGSTKLVSKEAIVATMAAGSGDIQLAFFNTCFSRGQAEAVVRHVAAAIGMKTSIGDEAARTFAAQFYSAIGFGLSIKRAFEQAKAALMLEGIPEASTPELFATEGLDPDQLLLVQP